MKPCVSRVNRKQIAMSNEDNRNTNQGIKKSSLVYYMHCSWELVRLQASLALPHLRAQALTL